MVYNKTNFGYIHCMNTTISLIIAIALCMSTSTNAQPIPVRQADQIDILSFTPPQVYQGQMVIRVRTTSQLQLDAMLGLVESIWTERTGVGVLDIQIKRENLDAISKLGIPHEVLIEDLQAHTNEGWNRIVEAERFIQTLDQRGATIHDDLWFANYKQLNEITTYIDNIATLRPDLASTMLIGQSWGGRDMFAITITGPDTPQNPQADRPVVYIFSTVHAREWIAPMTTVYFASKLAQDYDTDPRTQAILDSIRVVIVPMGNPDGYLYTWSDERYWRKTRRRNDAWSFGVDINRNWGYEWGGLGASDSPWSDTYHGTAPFSEPETVALRDLALSFGDQLVAHMEYHSYSQLVMWPFGYAYGNITPEPDRTYFDLLSNELSDEIKSVHGRNYTAMQSVDLYPAAGNAVDWFYGELDITSMIIELRPRSADFNPPPHNILPNAQENYQAIKRYLERAIEPFSIWHQSAPTLQADTPIELVATILDGLETFDPSSPTLYARTTPDDPFTPIAMSSIGENQYAANSPPVPCGQILEYYFQASNIDGDLQTYPPAGSASPFGTLAEQLVIAHADDFETETGWIVGSDTDTATAGIWTRMDPQEVLTKQGDIAQPENDRTSYGTRCWVTDGIAGANENDRDVDNGTTTLTSPIIDANQGNEPHISFWFWFYRSDSNYDHLRVDLSNDNGNTWSIARYYNNTGQQWIQREIRIADILEPTDQMRIRFVAYDNETDGIVEAAIDDLKVEYLGCPDGNPADFNNDGTLNFFDISAFIAALSNQEPEADFNNDGRWNFFDISAFLTAYANG